MTDLLARVGGLGVALVNPLSCSTTFAGTENPIVEDGLWLNGAANGIDWSNVRTTSNKAFGTQTEAGHGNGFAGGYNDSVALRRPLGRQWSPNQDVRGRIFITSRSGWTGNHEVELWTRGSMTANFTRGYEGLFSTVGGTTYFEIVRWNGPLALTNVDGGFTSLNFVNDTGVEDGTYVRFTAFGNVLSLYTSIDGISWGAPKLTATDSTWATGYPGHGYWTNGNGTLSTYGLSQWSAQQAMAA